MKIFAWQNEEECLDFLFFGTKTGGAMSVTKRISYCVAARKEVISPLRTIRARTLNDQDGAQRRPFWCWQQWKDKISHGICETCSFVFRLSQVSWTDLKLQYLVKGKFLGWVLVKSVINIEFQYKPKRVPKKCE